VIQDSWIIVNQAKFYVSRKLAGTIVEFLTDDDAEVLRRESQRVFPHGGAGPHPGQRHHSNPE
jgi:hypothetical protein